MPEIIKLKAEDYRAYNAVNYSTLSSMVDDPRTLINPQRETTDGMDLGSLVDCKLFTPNELESRFHIINIEKPGDKMGQMIDYYLNNLIPPSLLSPIGTEELNEELVIKAQQIVGWNTNYKRDTTIQHFKDKALPYIKAILGAGDKTIVPASMLATADLHANKLLTTDFAGVCYLLNGEGSVSVPKYLDFAGVQALRINYQACQTMQVTREMLVQLGVPKEKLPPIDYFHIKIKPDIVVEHALGIDIHDLKIISDAPKNFVPNYFFKYKYYIQSTLYTLFYKLLTKQPVNFYFILGSERFPTTVIPVGCFEQGLLGWTSATGIRYKGVLELIGDYYWHYEHDIFDYTPEEYYLINHIFIKDHTTKVL